jgi:hypothetical protein
LGKMPVQFDPVDQQLVEGVFLVCHDPDEGYNSPSFFDLEFGDVLNDVFDGDLAGDVFYYH